MKKMDIINFYVFNFFATPVINYTALINKQGDDNLKQKVAKNKK